MDTRAALVGILQRNELILAGKAGDGMTVPMKRFAFRQLNGFRHKRFGYAVIKVRARNSPGKSIAEPCDVFGLRHRIELRDAEDAPIDVLYLVHARRAQALHSEQHHFQAGRLMRIR